MADSLERPIQMETSYQIFGKVDFPFFRPEAGFALMLTTLIVFFETFDNEFKT